MASRVTGRVSPACTSHVAGVPCFACFAKFVWGDETICAYGLSLANATHVWVSLSWVVKEAKFGAWMTLCKVSTRGVASQSEKLPTTIRSSLSNQVLRPFTSRASEARQW